MPKRKNRLRCWIWLVLLAISLFGLSQTTPAVNWISRHLEIEPEIVSNLHRPAPPDWPVDADNYGSRSIIVYDLSRKQILFRKNIDIDVPVASLTKIMTAILAIEKIENLNDTARINSETISQMYSHNASTAGFRAGENARYIDLLYATMLPSGGEAALTLAESLSGSENEFANLMNLRAKELGMSRTVFKNSTGLDVDGQVSTPRDLVRLLRHALKNPTFRQIFTTPEYRTSPTPLRPQGIKFKHSVLSQISADEQVNFKVLGGKSGTTYAAELCWATLVEKNGREFLVITLGAPLDNLNNPTTHQKSDLLLIAQTIDTF